MDIIHIEIEQQNLIFADNLIQLLYSCVENLPKK